MLIILLVILLLCVLVAKKKNNSASIYGAANCFESSLSLGFYHQNIELQTNYKIAFFQFSFQVLDYMTQPNVSRTSTPFVSPIWTTAI